jgi:hypothetical protein
MQLAEYNIFNKTINFSNLLSSRHNGQHFRQHDGHQSEEAAGVHEGDESGHHLEIYKRIY